MIMFRISKRKIPGNVSYCAFMYLCVSGNKISIQFIHLLFLPYDNRFIKLNIRNGMVGPSDMSHNSCSAASTTVGTSIR